MDADNHSRNHILTAESCVKKLFYRFESALAEPGIQLKEIVALLYYIEKNRHELFYGKKVISYHWV